ncbi:MAG: FHA domain-containing protein [Armatimonadota bacterium]
MLRWLKRKAEEQKVEAETQEPELEPSAPLEFVTEQPTDGAWLETEDLNGQKIFLPLTRPSISIGASEECDVKLSENLKGIDKINPKHARIEQWRGRWVIVPFDRNSPVFVNGKRTGENALRDGAEICLGEEGVKFVFREAKKQE